MSVKLVSVAGAVAGSLMWASSASAVTVSIGTSTDGGVTVINQASAINATASFNGGVGSFTVSANGTGNPPLVGTGLLDSNTLDITGNTGNLIVYVTAQGLTSPTGLQSFLSTFTSNALTSGWTLTEETLLSASNQLFAGSILSSAAFASNGTSALFSSTNTGSGPYSVTEEFIIGANSEGSTNDTVDLSTAPLPGALPLFASGLLGLWGWSRKRKAGTAKPLGFAQA